MITYTTQEWESLNLKMSEFFDIDYIPSEAQPIQHEVITVGVSAFDGLNHTDASKKAISEGLKSYLKENRRVYTPERLKKMSESHLGQIPWNKGKPMSEETKSKLRAKAFEQHSKTTPRSGFKHSEETKAKIRAKRALQVNVKNQYSEE